MFKPPHFCVAGDPGKTIRRGFKILSGLCTFIALLFYQTMQEYATKRCIFLRHVLRFFAARINIIFSKFFVDFPLITLSTLIARSFHHSTPPAPRRFNTPGG